MALVESGGMRVTSQSVRFLEQGMRAGLLAVGLGFICGGTTASAEPINDVPAWAQRFTQAVLKSDVEEIVQTIESIADPRLNIDGFRPVVQGALNLVKTETPVYSEQFAGRDVGSFAKRINVAVRYTNNFLFYSVVLARGEKGWQLVQVNIDGNLNKILEAPWPS